MTAKKLSVEFLNENVAWFEIYKRFIFLAFLVYFVCTTLISSYYGFPDPGDWANFTKTFQIFNILASATSAFLAYRATSAKLLLVALYVLLITQNLYLFGIMLIDQMPVLRLQLVAHCYFYFVAAMVYHLHRKSVLILVCIHLSTFVFGISYSFANNIDFNFTILMLVFLLNLLGSILVIRIMDGILMFVQNYHESISMGYNELIEKQKVIERVLSESRHTIIVKLKEQFYQIPKDNVFSKRLKDLRQTSTFENDLVESICKTGARRVSTQNLISSTDSSSTIIFKDINERDYQITIGGIDQENNGALVSDITNFARSVEALNISLKASHTSVMCYDRAGQLILSKGTYGEVWEHGHFVNEETYENFIAKYKIRESNGTIVTYGKSTYRIVKKSFQDTAIYTQVLILD